eukprot:gene21952-28422_t
MICLDYKREEVVNALFIDLDLQDSQHLIGCLRMILTMSLIAFYLLLNMHGNIYICIDLIQRLVNGLIQLD